MIRCHPYIVISTPLKQYANCVLLIKKKIALAEIEWLTHETIHKNNSWRIEKSALNEAIMKVGYVGDLII